MAKGYRPVDRDQQFLIPPDMRDWLGTDHPVWTVIDIIDRIDTTAFHRTAKTGGAGRAGYHPDMLLTLLVWAWSRGERSSRRIERLCTEDVAYRVICAQDIPDHVTIARFRKTHATACEDLFTQVLLLAAALGLGRLETIALDSVKIASNASAAPTAPNRRCGPKPPPTPEQWRRQRWPRMRPPMPPKTNPTITATAVPVRSHRR
nr:transposase [Rhodococcus sp. DMF-1]